MLNFYETYDNLDGVLAVESASIKVDSAILAYEAFMNQKELKLREAELECVKESGTIEDLMEFYEETDEKTKDKENGLINNVWEAIKKFIASVKKFLFGDKDKKAAIDEAKRSNTDIDVDSGEWDFVTKSKDIIDSGINAFKTGPVKMLEWAKSNPLKVVLAGASATGTVVAVKSGKLAELMEFFKKKLTDVENMLKNAEQNKTGIASKVASVLKAVINGIKSVAGIVDKYILKNFKKAGNKVKDGVAGAAKSIKGKVAGKKGNEADEDESSYDESVEDFFNEADLLDDLYNESGYEDLDEMLDLLDGVE